VRADNGVVAASSIALLGSATREVAVMHVLRMEFGSRVAAGIVRGVTTSGSPRTRADEVGS